MYRTISKLVRIANDSVAIRCNIVTSVSNLYPDISPFLARVTSNLNQDTKAYIYKGKLKLLIAPIWILYTINLIQMPHTN